jgi:hypothetical protein
VLVDEAAGGGPGDLAGGNGNVLGPEPVAEMFKGTEERVDGPGGVTTANEELSEGVEQSAQGVSAEALGVMKAFEEGVEHGCPPGKEREAPGEHPDYAEFCLPRTTADSSNGAMMNWPDGSDSA